MCLNNFHVRALGLDREDTPGYVIRNGVVLECNSSAIELGIAQGMGIGEAKMLSQGAGCHQWKEELYELDRRSWLDLCANYTGIIEPVGTESAYLDLSAHPDPVFLLQRLRSDLIEHGWTVSCGAAGARWVAKLACEKDSMKGEALLTPRRFLAEYPSSRLPLPKEWVERLDFLGYKTVGEVAELDVQLLRNQFGNDAFEIVRYALGGGLSEVKAIYPPNSITEGFWYAGAPETEECFDRGLQEVTHRIALKLMEQDLCGERLDLFLEDEQAHVSHLGRTFSKPYHGYGALWSNLRLLSSQKKTAQISSVRLRAGELKKMKRVQLQLDVGFANPHRAERASQAVDRIHKIFGQESVLLGSQVQETRRQQVLKAWREVYGWT